MNSDDSLPSSDRAMAPEYALRVALQTLKKRCVSLHQRLALVEEENQILRSQVTVSMDDASDLVRPGGPHKSEADIFRQKIADLSRQNVKLNEQIGIIATENDQLWSRLSQLSKERNVDVDVHQNSKVTGQNLIRSRTFTQHTPNPNLRHKAVPFDGAEKDLNDLSLVEVALNSASEGGIHKRNDDAIETTLMNLTLDDYPAPDTDLNQQTLHCIDELRNMKTELILQQNDLKLALNALRDKFTLQECPECIKHRQKPETADKSLETDESLVEHKDTTTASEKYAIYQADPPAYVDILEQKRLADECDKMCPLCGKIYSSAIPFDDFREHVETHFIDDSELEPSLEHNFEFVSHTVGNF